MEENKTKECGNAAAQVGQTQTADDEQRKEAARSWLADYIRRVQNGMQTNVKDKK